MRLRQHFKNRTLAPNHRLRCSWRDRQVLVWGHRLTATIRRLADFVDPFPRTASRGEACAARSPFLPSWPPACRRRLAVSSGRLTVTSHRFSGFCHRAQMLQRTHPEGRPSMTASQAASHRPPSHSTPSLDRTPLRSRWPCDVRFRAEARGPAEAAATNASREIP